jgi:hypothetical protein
MSDRLNPENKGNARLLYIDGDAASCDICDEKSEAAVIDTTGGSISTTIRICEKCLQEILRRFSN